MKHKEITGRFRIGLDRYRIHIARADITSSDGQECVACLDPVTHTATLRDHRCLDDISGKIAPALYCTGMCKTCAENTIHSKRFERAMLRKLFEMHIE
ncbi:hypothetical protein EHS17_14375 [Rhodobacteraceae bacterium CH30]|nr:hypothetical protein EHS17_14375 [Rhodobacteraceae bacterium CH30]